MPEQEDQEPSFDPRTWVKPSSAASTSAPKSTSAPPKTNANRTSPLALLDRGANLVAKFQKLKSRTRLGITVAIGLLMLLLGATLLLSRHGKDATQVRAPSDPQMLERRTVGVSGLSDIERALNGADVSTDDTRKALDAVRPYTSPLQGDMQLEILVQGTGPHPHLLGLEVRREDGSTLKLIEQKAGVYVAVAAKAKLTSRMKVVRGEMDGDSFYSSAVSAGLIDNLISPFAQAFAFEFDFQRDIHKGDIFEAVFQENADDAGKTVGERTLVFVLLETKSRSKAFYRFQPQGENPGWFDANGTSVIRSLMKTPVEGARVSSTFGMREHPILGFLKLHTGVDFASPVGTPVYAAGDGVVEFAEPKGPNGNMVKLRHRDGSETLYLHLKDFAPGLRAGAAVRQGQDIGQVGTTGRSTGPHLHYEVHIDGQPVDPATVATDAGRMLGAGQMAAFRRTRDAIDADRTQQNGG